MKSCVIRMTKKQNFGSLSYCCYCADRAQFARVSYEHLADIVPDFIQIGSLSAEL